MRGPGRERTPAGSESADCYFTDHWPVWFENPEFIANCTDTIFEVFGTSNTTHPSAFSPFGRLTSDDIAGPAAISPNQESNRCPSLSAAFAPFEGLSAYTLLPVFTSSNCAAAQRLPSCGILNSSAGLAVGSHFFRVTSSCSPSSRPLRVRVSPTAAVLLAASLSLESFAALELLDFGVLLTVSSGPQAERASYANSLRRRRPRPGDKWLYLLERVGPSVRRVRTPRGAGCG
jgi:hypothetical protein